jgi:hypothetical protein
MENKITDLIENDWQEYKAGYFLRSVQQTHIVETHKDIIVGTNIKIKDNNFNKDLYYYTRNLYQCNVNWESDKERKFYPLPCKLIIKDRDNYVERKKGKSPSFQKRLVNTNYLLDVKFAENLVITIEFLSEKDRRDYFLKVYENHDRLIRSDKFNIKYAGFNCGIPLKGENPINPTIDQLAYTNNNDELDAFLENFTYFYFGDTGIFTTIHHPQMFNSYKC